MGFFGNTGVVGDGGLIGAGEVDALKKALSAGYGTDASAFTGGRALIPENIEAEIMSVMATQKEDCKLMSSMKKTLVKSTVHEFNVRNSAGQHRYLTVPEGGSSTDNAQDIERKTVEIKYLQDRRSVTHQMTVVDTFEDALASEKLQGSETLLRAAEYLCFHGDKSIVPTEYDGLIATILKSDEKDRNIMSLRGHSLGYKGEGALDDMALQIYQQGGFADKLFFPPVLARDIRELFSDKLRLNVKDSIVQLQQFPDYPTAVGSTLVMSGDSAGADKFYEVKGVVNAEGNTKLRPAAPATVTGTPKTSVKGSQFGADGAYKYIVHAINAYGISEGTSPAAAVQVTKDGSVELTITAGTGEKPTGYIICRSIAGGDEMMEMARCAYTGASTVFIDKNDDLPGTASMLMLTTSKIQPVYSFAQLLPASTFPLYPTAVAEHPFLVLLFGALEVRAPKFCGLIKDMYYTGGLNNVTATA